MYKVVLKSLPSIGCAVGIQLYSTKDFKIQRTTFKNHFLKTCVGTLSCSNSRKKYNKYNAWAKTFDNTHNKLLTQKLLKQGYRYHKLRKTFSKF